MKKKKNVAYSLHHGVLNMWKQMLSVHVHMIQAQKDCGKKNYNWIFIAIKLNCKEG